MKFIFALLVAAFLMISSSNSEAKDREIRVMTFNIRNGRANDGEDRWENRRQMAADLIRAEKVDLLGIQEAYRDQIDDLLKALPEYGEIGAGRDDGKSKGEHSQILYRKDRFRVEDHGTFWFSDTPEVPKSATWGNRVTRICTWARLEDRAKRRHLYFYNLHLDHESQPSREKSATLLLERLRQRSHLDPVIVTGDFNAGEDNPAIHLMTESASPKLQETFRRVHPDEKEVSTFHGFHGGTTGDKIDFIFTTEEFHAKDAAILHLNQKGRYPSDHYPVTARLIW